jgi:Uma2 family endonuclease
MGTGTEEASKFISESDYLINEATAEIKSQYDNGVVTAMAGAQTEHNYIVANMIRLLGNCAVEKDCVVFPSDMVLDLPKCKRYVYPDVMMVCGKRIIKRKEKNGLDALYNPTLIVEVSSPSTEQDDQIKKRDCYFELKSLKQYVLIDSQKKSVWVYTRNGSDSEDWLLTKYKDENEQNDSKEDKKIKLKNCTIKMSEIYRSTEL